MAVLKVSDVCRYAIFEQDGVALREKIMDVYDNGENVTLDFEGISLFATMFFNASVGWLVLRDGPETVNSRIKYINLSELGETTWKHSFNNAIQVRNDPVYQQAVQNYDEEGDDD